MEYYKQRFPKEKGVAVATPLLFFLVYSYSAAESESDPESTTS